MKFIGSLTLFIFLAACSEHPPGEPLQVKNHSAVIYHGDSREEITQTSSLGELAKATAILVDSIRLLQSRNSISWTIQATPLKQHFPLCQDEAFLEQTTLGFCSGVLIAPNKVLTAGHCVTDKDACKNTKFIFGWNLEKSQNKSLPDSEIYSCQNILAQKNSRSKGLDYAIVELDRPVTGVTPVKLASEILHKKGDSLLSLSYPLGLPLKKDMAKVLEDIGERNIIKMEVDTFSGSSGSPLFNAQGELVGILSMGMEDILEDDIYRVQKDGGCINFNRCRDGVCFGESYLKATRIDL